MTAESSNVVVIDPAFLGDVVFDGPLVRALRSRYPNGRIGLVVRPPADAIAERMSGVDRVHVFDKYGADRGIKGLRRVAADLASEGYDAAYIPHPSPRSTLLAFLAGIPRRIGDARNVAGLFLTERVRASGADTFVEARLRLLGADPAADPTADRARAGLHGSLRPGDAAASDRRVGLVLGSAWETKRWPPERAAQLARSLESAGTTLVLIGAEWERPLFSAVLALDGANVEDRLGGSVAQMLDALSSCAAVVAGDTGPLHAARAMGVPVIGLFGPTSADRHTFADRDEILSVPLDCRPCSAHGARSCPLGHLRCMQDLDADLVGRAVLRVVRGSN